VAQTSSACPWWLTSVNSPVSGLKVVTARPEVTSMPMSGVNSSEASLSRRTTRGYPGGMLAFLQKKFVGSYLALRATSRVHWPSVYACRTRSAASSLVKFT
jgi:hypothetical protein